MALITSKESVAAQEKEEKKLLKEVEEGREARQQLITQVQENRICQFSEVFKSCPSKGGRPSRDIGEKTLPGINCRAHSYNSHLLEG